MTLPWFAEDLVVDHAALEQLGDVAGRTATVLEETATARLRIGAEGLARCAGPYAEDLADALGRVAAAERALAAACRRLAALALARSAEARREQARRGATGPVPPIGGSGAGW
jgi:hypothetical protein